MLYQCLERECSAWRILHDPKAMQDVNADGMLELAKRAGYSEEAAQKAANAVANTRMDRNLPP